jgi:hypothetical protein
MAKESESRWLLWVENVAQYRYKKYGGEYLFICGLFNDAVSSLNYIASNDRMNNG